MGAMGRENRREENGGGEWERRVVRGIARGDGVAMRDFYDAYAPYLTAICCRYVGNMNDVKDVFQDSIVKIFGSIAQFEYRGPCSLKAWASRIVVNESLKWLKGRNRLRMAAITEEIAEPEDDELPDFTSIPAATITEMISTLPDGYRTVFNLYVFEQKSHREISAMLGIAERSSSSQYYRARCILAKRIKEYGPQK